MVSPNELPAPLQVTFERLCNSAPDTNPQELLNHVRTVLRQLVTAKNPLLFSNLRDAIWLADRCLEIIGRLPGWSPEEQRLGVGAIRYFVVHLDSVPDLEPELGFQDDKVVMHHALARLGIPHELPGGYHE